MKIILLILFLLLIIFVGRAILRSFEKMFEKTHSELKKYPTFHSRVHEGLNTYSILLPKGQYWFNIKGETKGLVEENLFNFECKVHFGTTTHKLYRILYPHQFWEFGYNPIYKKDGDWYEFDSKIDRLDSDRYNTREIWDTSSFRVREEEQLVTIEVDLKKNLQYNPMVHIRLGRPTSGLK